MVDGLASVTTTTGTTWVCVCVAYVGIVLLGEVLLAYCPGGKRVGECSEKAVTITITITISWECNDSWKLDQTSVAPRGSTKTI